MTAAARPLEAFPAVATSDVDLLYHEAQRLMSRHSMYAPAHLVASSLIRGARLGSTGLLYFEYGFGTEISSLSLEGYSTVHIPLEGALEFEDRGERHRVSAGEGAVFSDGMPVRMRWSDDLRLLVARIDQQALISRLGLLLPGHRRNEVVFETLLRAPGVTGVVRTIADILGRSGGDLSPSAARELEDMLLTCLLIGQLNNHTSDILAPALPASPRTIRLAMEFIEGRYDESIAAADIAAAAGVAERSLYEAFRRRFGLSPTQYLRDVRLDRARALLLAGDTDVAGSAHAVGFHHPGRFAAAYRNRFGEPPSRTLRGRD